MTADATDFDVRLSGRMTQGKRSRRLSEVFEAGATVDPEALAAKGLVKNNANRDWPVKILAQGEIDRALTVRAHAVSAAARVKIEAAGGTVEIIGEAATTE